MARLARVVAPGVPHHITQRGNRRQQTFFCQGDYEAYVQLMAEWCHREGVEVWAYCLMPNHVHLIAVPESPESLRRALGEAHRRYTRGVNFREGWRGHLWQGRFASFPMDEAHTLQAARYIELNPMRAGLARRAREYQWSSAAAHGLRRNDALVRVRPLLDMVGKAQWGKFLGEADGRGAVGAAATARADGPAAGRGAFPGAPGIGTESRASSAEARTKGAVEAQAHTLSTLSQRLAARPLPGTG